MSMTVDIITANQGLSEAITGAKRLVWRALLLHALDDAQISSEEPDNVKNSRRVEEKVMKILIYDIKICLLTWRDLEIATCKELFKVDMELEECSQLCSLRV